MNGMKCTERKSDHERLDLPSLVILSRVFWLRIFRVRLTQSTAMEQKRFDLRSLSPAPHNLWLLLLSYTVSIAVQTTELNFIGSPRKHSTRSSSRRRPSWYIVKWYWGAVIIDITNPRKLCKWCKRYCVNIWQHRLKKKTCSYILMQRLSDSPKAPVCDARSDPARSTKF